MLARLLITLVYVNAAQRVVRNRGQAVAAVHPDTGIVTIVHGCGRDCVEAKSAGHDERGGIGGGRESEVGNPHSWST